VVTMVEEKQLLFHTLSDPCHLVEWGRKVGAWTPKLKLADAVRPARRPVRTWARASHAARAHEARAAGPAALATAGEAPRTTSCATRTGRASPRTGRVFNPRRRCVRRSAPSCPPGRASTAARGSTTPAATGSSSPRTKRPPPSASPSPAATTTQSSSCPPPTRPRWPSPSRLEPQ
jgi:hypothetical protein